MMEKSYEDELYSRLRSMHLHQTIYSDDMVITKVINGWIYRFKQTDSIIMEDGEIRTIDNITSPCFVPRSL